MEGDTDREIKKQAAHLGGGGERGGSDDLIPGCEIRYHFHGQPMTVNRDRTCIPFGVAGGDFEVFS